MGTEAMIDTSTEAVRLFAFSVRHGSDSSLLSLRCKIDATLRALAEERDRLVAERDAAVAEAEAAVEKAKDAEAEQDGVRDSAVDFVFTVLEKALGVTKWSPCDGTETWDGDVQGSVYELLYAAKVLDPETGERVTDRLATAEADAARLREALTEILDYQGGAASALDDPYVMDRANAARTPPVQETRHD